MPLVYHDPGWLGRGCLPGRLRNFSQMGPYVDEVEVSQDGVSQIKLELLKRWNPEWGFSLHEVEVLEPGAKRPPIPMALQPMSDSGDGQSTSS